MVENHPIEFSFVAGHSLGEYSALVAAGGLRFQDAVRLVRNRGRYMQEAVPEGKGMMAAILGLDRSTLEGICRESSHSGYVAMANYNSPDQVVIAGERGGVECAMEMARARGAKRVIPLPVSVPSHCALMESASRRLKGDLLTVEVADLKVPLVNNAEGRPISKGEEIKPSLVRQLASPLLWEESIRFMISSGVSIFVEIGPGRVLSGLVKRIDRSVQILPVEDVRALQETLNIVG
jgi:[acyl-carrier-protein] S-malonyltransferase